MTAFDPTSLPDPTALLDMALEAEQDAAAATPFADWLRIQAAGGLQNRLDPSDMLTVVSIVPGGRDCRLVDEVYAPLRAELARLESGDPEAVRGTLLRWHDGLLAVAERDRRLTRVA